MRKHSLSKALGERLADSSGLPLDLLTQAPLLQLLSDRELIVEGAKHLERYECDFVRIRTQRMYVCIQGHELSLKCLANQNISVCGRIEEIHLERLPHNVKRE